MKFVKKNAGLLRSVRSWGALGLILALMLGNATSAVAESMHARSTIFVVISQSRCAPANGAADASVSKKVFGKTRYRVSHEELYSNYTYGNAGSGHAHHHYSEPCPQYGIILPPGDRTQPPPPPPMLGSPGTSQYILQTWLPNTAGDKITVAWSPTSFLQVDLSQLTPGNRLASRASLNANSSLVGSVELSAWLDDKLMPHTDTNLTGIFKGLAFDLVSHPGGIVSLQFSNPVNWTVPGNAEMFDIELEGSIDGVETEICGIKWNDLNGNGQYEPNLGESVLQGWTIEVRDQNGIVVATETTDQDGTYCVTVSAGTYTVSEVLQPGWTQTFPGGPGIYTVTVPPSATNINFGNRRKEDKKCDLAIKKSVSPNPVQSGQQVIFTLTVQNVGTGPCQGITTVTDGPLSWLQVSSVAQGGSLWNCSVAPPNPGATVTCTWNASIQPVPPGPLPTISITGTVVAPAGSQPQNCATVSNPNDTNMANNQSCVTIQVGGKPPVCDLAIKKTASPNPVESGKKVTITLVVTNVGTAACQPGPFPGTIVRDNKPNGLTFNLPVSVNQPGWQCGLEVPAGNLTCATPNTLPVNYQATFTFTATVTAPASSIPNCATVTNANDTNAANNQSCVTIQVIVPPPLMDLALLKARDGNLVSGKNATYVLTMTNVGQDPMSAAIPVTDSLPEGLGFVPATGDGFNCAALDQIVNCTGQAVLMPNASADIKLTVCAEVSTPGGANLANNQGCDTATVS